MPLLPCPACGHPTARKQARVNFYRCASCHHIWTVNKLDPDKVTHVTPLPVEANAPKKN